MKNKNLIFVWASLAALGDIIMCRGCIRAVHCEMDGACYTGLKDYVPAKCLIKTEKEEQLLLYPISCKTDEDASQTIEKYKQHPKVRLIVLINSETKQVALLYGDLGPVASEDPYLHGIEMLYEIEKGEKISISKIKDCRQPAQSLLG